MNMQKFSIHKDYDNLQLPVLISTCLTAHSYLSPCLQDIQRWVLRHLGSSWCPVPPVGMLMMYAFFPLLKYGSSAVVLLNMNAVICCIVMLLLLSVLGIRTTLVVLESCASVCTYDNTDGIKCICHCALCVYIGFVCISYLTLVLVMVGELSTSVASFLAAFCSLQPVCTCSMLQCLARSSSLGFCLTRQFPAVTTVLCCLTQRSLGVNFAGFFYRPHCPFQCSISGVRAEHLIAFVLF